MRASVKRCCAIRSCLRRSVFLELERPGGWSSEYGEVRGDDSTARLVLARLVQHATQLPRANCLKLATALLKHPGEWYDVAWDGEAMLGLYRGQTSRVPVEPMLSALVHAIELFRK
jgi:hypothetical protein